MYMYNLLNDLYKVITIVESSGIYLISFERLIRPKYLPVWISSKSAELASIRNKMLLMFRICTCTYFNSCQMHPSPQYN